MGDVTHYAGDQCPGGHYEETTVSEPMTDDDLVNISHRLACRYVFRDEDTGEMWIDGGALQRVDVEALLVEVHRLQDIIRSKEEEWDREYDTWRSV